jgi:putative membrane protein insertion efficiency factor
MKGPLASAAAWAALAPRRAVLWLLRVYKRGVSPLLPPACRYHPSCSEYAREAVERHGLRVGLWLGLKRLLRCHPFARGGLDPPP